MQYVTTQRATESTQERAQLYLRSPPTTVVLSPDINHELFHKKNPFLKQACALEACCYSFLALDVSFIEGFIKASLSCV